MGAERHTSDDLSEPGAVLIVGRVGAPHGVRGEVTVEVRTDEPAERFAFGSVLGADPSSVGPLVVEASRWHGSRLLVRFAGRSGRSAVEALSGTLLVVNSTDLPPSEDENEFHDHELVDLAVVTCAGNDTGAVVDVLHLPSQDVLVVRSLAGMELLVPFVSAIVREVDRDRGRIVIDPPPGLTDPDVMGSE